MTHILYACIPLLSQTALSDIPPVIERAAYEQARSRPGMGPDEHVRLALRCEANGMTAERLKHLTIAILRDPTHAAARGLLGQIDDGGKWRSPEEVEARVRADRKLSYDLGEYSRRRARARDTADDQWKLALWCEECGLTPESRAHLTAVTRLDPSRASAWKKLGYELDRGRWISRSMVESEKAARLMQDQAHLIWLPRLEDLRRDLDSPARRDAARAQLARVTDPRAVPAVWRVFAQGKGDDHATAVQLLGQIDSPGSTRALALIAVFSPFNEVRRAAAETLRRRDPRETAGLLVGLLRDPDANRPDLEAFRVRCAFRLSGEAGFGTPGFVAIETRWFSSLSVYTLDEDLGRFADIRGNSAYSYVYRTTVLRQRQLAEIATLVAPLVDAGERAFLAHDATAQPIRRLSARVFPELEATTGQRLGEDREGWKRWWTEELGYVYEPPTRPTVPNEGATEGPKPHYVRWYHSSGLFSCFAAGTEVRTRGGLRAIETLAVGDQVLTQDTTTGALGFEPIMRVAHNPPSATIRIRLEGDTLVTTGIHRFWKVGEGWVMARALKVGDIVRTLDGLSRVLAVTEGTTQPVYNLEVFGPHDYFVGKGGALVHDESPIEPVAAPFDAFPSLVDAFERR
jgi:hypothetical protein